MQSSHQSKSKGMASGLMLALKAFLNSSNVIVPELSLSGTSRYTWSLRTESGGDCIHVEILEGDEVIRVRPLQQRLEHHKVFPGDQTTLGGIGDTEQDGELASTDSRQILGGGNGPDE